MAFRIVNGECRKGLRGFTLIELLVVLAIIATLISIAAPQYFGAADRAKETVLREDLNVMRDAIGKYHGDTGKYPDSLQTLVDRRYLRAIPVDPITEKSDSWLEMRGGGTSAAGVQDVRSGAPGKASDGTLFKDF
jgi:general secretion pathway protein G